MLKLIFCAFLSCAWPGQNLLEAKLSPGRPAPACGTARSPAKLELFARRLPRALPPARCCSCPRCRDARVSGACKQRGRSPGPSCREARPFPPGTAAPLTSPPRVAEGKLPPCFFFRLFFRSFGKDRRENTAGVAGGGTLAGRFRRGADVTWCRWLHGAAFVSVGRVRWCVK